MKKHSTKKLVCSCVATGTAVLVVTLSALIFFCGGFKGGAFLLKLNAVRAVIENTYVGDVDWSRMETAASNAMIDVLGDRWSYYMTESQYESYLSYSSNITRGIGVTVTKDEDTGGFLITKVAEGSPAAESGLVPGQIIIAIEGEDVTGLVLSEISEVIQSREETFEITVLDGQTEINIQIYIAEVFNNPVSCEMLEGDIGYIKIDNFEDGACSGAVAAIEALAEQGMTSIIFDVRSNPGGKLSELIELLDYILPEGEIFVSVDKNGNETVYESKEGCIEYPMAVLINSGSYSAAEFFAAALREYGYAGVIGEASTGKGRSQQTFDLYDGSAVHISTRRYLTPNRVDLSEQGGLTPDVEVTGGGETDGQLEAAIKYLS